MSINKIQLNNITVFDDFTLEFSPGINVFLGENGLGKTHLMKILYSACQSSKSSETFPHKITKCFFPDEFKINRLISRRQGNTSGTIKVWASKEDTNGNKVLSTEFSNKTKKWDAVTKGEEGWEKTFSAMSSIFIPAKEILSNSYNLQAAVDKENVRFDDTYIDIINSAKINITPGKNSNGKEKKLKEIEKIISGKVHYDSNKDQFYLKSGNSSLEFNLLAEGIRKIALLWQLVKNGTLEKGSVLFWDEPESNINPIHIPVIVDILLMLQSEGVQIFITTHDYFLSKYLNKRTENSTISFISLYKESDTVRYEKNTSFIELKKNSIMDSFFKLYYEEIGLED